MSPSSAMAVGFETNESADSHPCGTQSYFTNSDRTKSCFTNRDRIKIYFTNSDRATHVIARRSDRISARSLCFCCPPK